MDIRKFMEQRSELNDIVFKYAGTGTKRFWHLDSCAFKDGALSRKVKELIGLAVSLTLRCDDCVSYHLLQCHNLGVSDAEFEEAVHIALMIGGSITIPHIRRAFKGWDELRDSKETT